MSHNLCVIPARGGSQRIKGKNVRDFCGKPIISYPIQTAIESKLFDEVIVYTDSQEIDKVANQYGATTPLFRAQESPNDTATLTDTILEVLIKYEDTNKWFENICCLLPTAVFVTKEDLISSYNFLNYKVKVNPDCVVSFVKYNHPIQRAFRISLNNFDLKSPHYFQMLHPEYALKRTQDLEPSYFDAGQLYWLNTESFLKQKKIFMNQTVGYQIDAVDIDNEEDWRLAELKYKLKKGLI